MLKTPWKEWKDSAQNHYILFCFAPIVRKTPHILCLIPFKSRTFQTVRVSGLDVFDDVADRLPQMLVVLHIPLHGLEGVDDGGMIAARELPADLLHAHPGDFAQDVDGNLLSKFRTYSNRYMKL